MFFLTMIAKNLLRRPARSLLTLVGIAVGIAAVVAMTSIAAGFETTWERIYAARGVDIIVTKITGTSPVPEPFDESLGEALHTLPQVDQVAGLLAELTGIEEAPMVVIHGWQQPSFLWDHLQLIEGRWPTNAARKEVLMGRMLADTMRKKVGDPVQLEAETFTVCGVVESGAFVENSAVIMPLRELQRITGNPGKVKFFNLRVLPGTTPAQLDQLCRELRARYPMLKIYQASEVARQNMGIQMAKAMSWATSAIALAVGAVGVANTVLMTVFERIHEIGILLAIGWRRRRIVSMILYEATVLSFIGGVVGCGLGVLAVKCIQLTPIARGKIEGDISAATFLIALAIAVGLGLLGGLYPAFRGSRLQPTEALRYE